jgi:hypothetical protein
MSKIVKESLNKPKYVDRILQTRSFVKPQYNTVWPVAKGWADNARTYSKRIEFQIIKSA